MRIVPTFDPREDRRTSFIASQKVTVIEQFTFQAGEEALGHRVVEAVAHAAHRWLDAESPAANAKRNCGVLGTVIGMTDHLLGRRRWPASGQGSTSRDSCSCSPVRLCLVPDSSTGTRTAPSLRSHAPMLQSKSLRSTSGAPTPLDAPLNTVPSSLTFHLHESESSEATTILTEGDT